VEKNKLTNCGKSNRIKLFRKIIQKLATVKYKKSTKNITTSEKNKLINCGKSSRIKLFRKIIQKLTMVK